jgi:hypothetical protein
MAAAAEALAEVAPTVAELDLVGLVDWVTLAIFLVLLPTIQLVAQAANMVAQAMDLDKVFHKQTGLKVELEMVVEAALEMAEASRKALLEEQE